MARRGFKKLISDLMGLDKAEQVDEQEETQSTLEETVIRLQHLVEERTFVDVHFPGKGNSSYQSLILKVDPLENFVLIDELFPSHGALFISPGDEVEITSVRKGIPVRFSTWVKSISIDEEDGIPAYRLALPTSVEAKQRRKNFRVPVDPDSGVKLRIRGSDGAKLLCTVQNLSFCGVGFTCQGNMAEQFKANSILRNCALSIPGVPDIALDLEVRSFEFRRQPYRNTLVGSRIQNLTTASEKQLEHYLVLIQRQQRRDHTKT